VLSQRLDVLLTPANPAGLNALADAMPELAGVLGRVEPLLDGIPDPALLRCGSPKLPPRNALFVGRKEDLRASARALKGGSTAAIGQVATATGLGSIGKTRLAAEFAHRYGRAAPTRHDRHVARTFTLSYKQFAAIEQQAAAGVAQALVAQLGHEHNGPRKASPRGAGGVVAGTSRSCEGVPSRLCPGTG
jgi:hypothetical protein